MTVRKQLRINISEDAMKRATELKVKMRVEKGWLYEVIFMKGLDALEKDESRGKDLFQSFAKAFKPFNP